MKTQVYRNLDRYFFNEMGHDFCKLTTCGAGNYVLDILAGGETEMIIELRMSKERVNLPGYVEFELVQP